MNIIRKAVTALGSVFLAALLIAALAPKATRGIAAALVQVTNTSANPVPNQDVDNPARAVRAPLNCGANSTVGSVLNPGLNLFNCTLLDVSGNHFFVPAGQRLVIEQIDGLCTTPTGQVVPEVFVQFVDAGGSNFGHILPVTPQGGGGGIAFFAFNQPVRWVADPGSDFTFFLQTSDLTGSTSCSLDLSGHLISFP